MVKTDAKKVGVIATVCAVSSCLFLLLCLSILTSASIQNQPESMGEGTELPDLDITAVKPYHYEWSEEYGLAKGDPWFNLVNYVNITVKNNGTANAGSFKVKLYADDELIGHETVDDLGKEAAKDVKFVWMPEGEDPLSWTDTAEGAKLSYDDTDKNYTLKAVVDEADDVQELNETNNEVTQEQKVVWNGFMADEPLEIYEHDSVNGGIVYTTGDGVYRSDESGDSGTVYGSPYDINYELQIPGSTKLARLYVYYTWAEPKSSLPKAPKIGATLKTPGGTTTDLSLDTSYNDIKNVLNYPYHAWGTYAYDITNYVQESGTYIVTVENLNDGSDDDFTDEYSFAAPAMLVVYENATAPKREYWINEGADALMGGRDERAEGGFLGLEDCLNTAEFSGEHLNLEVEEAVLGVVAPWADDSEDDALIFNGAELGEGLYNGYFDAWSSSEDIKGISMHIGADEAQQGMAAIDVTRYLEEDDNEVIQGDDGDNMMPANAFLVITYKEEEEEESGDSGSGSGAKDNTTATPTPGSTAPAATITKASRTVPLLEAGKEVAMIFQDMDVSMLALRADTDVSDAKVVVERVDKPYELPEPSGIPYVYLDITVEHEMENAHIEGRIEFKVAKSWISANNIDETAVTLNKYHEREGWKALPTSKVGEEENVTVYFEAATAEFSTFAVTGEKNMESAPTQAPSTTPLPTVKPTATPASHEMEQKPEADGASMPGFELMLSLGLLIIGAYLVRKVKPWN